MFIKSTQIKARYLLEQILQGEVRLKNIVVIDGHVALTLHTFIVICAFGVIFLSFFIYFQGSFLVVIEVYCYSYNISEPSNAILLQKQKCFKKEFQLL